MQRSFRSIDLLVASLLAVDLTLIKIRPLLPPSTASWFHFAPKLQPARNSNKRAREPKLNELGSKHLHLTHDVSLAGNIDNRAREPNPNELSGTTSTSRDVPLVGNIDKRAREPAPNELGWNNLHLTHAMCRWPATSTSGLVSPFRTGGVRRDLAAGRPRPGLVSPALGEKSSRLLLSECHQPAIGPGVCVVEVAGWRPRLRQHVHDGLRHRPGPVRCHPTLPSPACSME